ncbi:MAG: hypothetical protein UR61_C0015G0006 [candidate division WS6 bacterium GW2011_GWE1_34_7]|uniref:Uncharacterized protein n=1 Tax=candidate division WS6 bacterium GW2011_GWE1_34_7 TaxID=1619093 RepID=A0A0G0B8H4_9BACT|nr:MAG: hypothetical protein UR61_C0015G0006 [candidate division WS6 bacterium GW2011_GWE1_34_7]
MKKMSYKLNAVLLLIGMSLASVAIVSVTNLFRKPPTMYIPPNYEILQTQTEESNTVSAEDDTSTPSRVETRETGLVLSATSTSGINQCGPLANKIDSESVCRRDSTGQVDFFNSRIPWPGQRVSVNATVYLYYVPVPLELFSGMNVEDSNRLISKEAPTFKAAGEQWEDTSANVMLPPGTQIDEYKGWVEDEPFGMKYNIGFLLGDGIRETQEGHTGINEKLPNDCEYCKNPSNPNPEKSNTIGEFMLDSVYRYPGEKTQVEEEEVMEECSDQDRFVPWPDTNFDACIASLPAVAVSFIKSITEPTWFDCIIHPSQCMDPKDIVIIMSSPFGSDKDCLDGFCTNAYMDTRNSTALPPTNSGGGKFYYVTECKAIIQGRDYDIQCAWDMSHLYKEKQVAGFDDLPTVESIPTDDEYNQFLLEEVKGARDIAIPL